MGLGKWLIQVLTPKLRQLPHLLRDSSSLVRDLRHMDYKNGLLLTKLDVKDYYLCGDFRRLAETVAMAAPDSSSGFADTIEAVTYFLVSNQYIGSRHSRDNVWSAARGTGMGLVMSGELSDWCFW